MDAATADVAADATTIMENARQLLELANEGDPAALNNLLTPYLDQPDRLRLARLALHHGNDAVAAAVLNARVGDRRRAGVILESGQLHRLRTALGAAVLTPVQLDYALRQAVKSGDVDMANWLLERDAAPNRALGGLEPDTYLGLSGFAEPDSEECSHADITWRGASDPAMAAWLLDHVAPEICRRLLLCAAPLCRGDVAALDDLFRRGAVPGPGDEAWSTSLVIATCQVASLEWFAAHGATPAHFVAADCLSAASDCPASLEWLRRYGVE